MLIDGVTVGHARDIVGHRLGAGVQVPARPLGETPPLAGKKGRGFEKRGKQLLDQARRLPRHAVDAEVAVHPLAQKAAHRLVGGGERGAEGDHRPALGLHRRRARERGETGGRGGGDVADEAVDDAADHFVAEPSRLPCSRRLRLGEGLADHRQGGEVLEREEPGAQPVIEVMGVIGDIVGQRRHLRLGRGLARKIEIEGEIEAQDLGRMRRMAGAVVLDQPLERLRGEVEPVEGGVAALEPGDHTERLQIVIKPPPRRRRPCERLLAGMAEGRMTEVMGEGKGLGEVLIEAEAARNGAGDLGDLERVGEAGAEEVTLVIDEDLRLVLQLAEGGAVDDAVAVALEGAARRRLRLPVEPAAGLVGLGGVGGERIHRRPHTPFVPPLQSPTPFNPPPPAAMYGGMEQARFSLSPSAVRRLREVLAPGAGQPPGGGLRVAVLAGGCQGFQYRFSLEPAPAEDDVVIETDGVRVFIDPVSLTLLEGAELDYAEELIGAYFRVRNPNAASSCGCGSSFAPA